MLQLGYRIDVLGQIRFQFILAIILIILCFLYKPIKGLDYDHKSLVIVSFTLIFFLFLSVLYSIDSSHSWNVFVERVVKFSFISLFIYAFSNSIFSLKGAVFFFLLSCLKLGQEGLYGTITGSLIWENQGIMRLHGSTPIYHHPNSFSGMAVGTLPFIIFLFNVSNKYIKMGLIILAILSLNIIIFSGSRTGYVAVVLLLLLLFFQSNQKIKILIAAILILSIGISYIPDQYIGRFESIFTLKEAEGKSSESRLEILEESIEVFLNNPLGIGVDSFPVYRNVILGKKAADTHNLYTQILTNIGAHGLLVFFIFIILIRKKLKKIHETGKKLLKSLDQISNNQVNQSVIRKYKKDIQFLLALTKVILYYLYMRLILGVFGHDLYEMYWWLILGFTLALNKIIILHSNEIVILKRDLKGLNE